MPKVTAICVSYNCADLLRVTLRTLVAQDVPGGMEILVVDNASEDDSVAAARSFAGVAVYPLARNVGFGAANNLGARIAKGDYLLFVNPDVEVSQGVVAALANFLGGRAEAVAAGPLLVDRDGSVQRFCARRFPTPLNLALQVCGWGETRWAGSALLHRFYNGRYYGRGPARAEVLTGAFLMARRDAFAAVGGFDEGFFLYGEDVDLCRRLAGRGELWFVPVGPVKHFTGGSRREPDPLVVVAAHASAIRYAVKWHGRTAAVFVAFCSRVGVAIRRFVFRGLGAFSGRARGRADFYDRVAELTRARQLG